MDSKYQKKLGPTRFQIANGEMGVTILHKGEVTVLAGEMKGSLDLNKKWEPEGFFEGGKPTSPLKFDTVQVTATDGTFEILVPREIIENNPAFISFEWLIGKNAK